MKIIIVDDDTENLDAARKASEDFSGHEFLFFLSASEAAEVLESADAIVSDLFFPPEDCSGLLGELYESYKSEMNHHIFFQIVEEYYGGEWNEAVQKREDAIALLGDGTIRYSVEGLVKFFKDRMRVERSEWRRKMDAESIQKYEEVLKNLPAPQFPYGGALILEAKRQGKFHCLVSDIHRHAGEYKDASGAIDGMALLIPPMGAKVLSVEQGRFDGEGSATYIGGDQLWEIGEMEGKTSPKVWRRAIENCIVQKTVP